MGVQIREMRVPSVVESGKKNHVILDCDYDISSESEGQQVDVKWFFRNDPEPFFQWLPGRAPQAKGNLFSNGRLDLTYEVEGGNRFQKHRALKIMRPTTELSGTYRCKVSSFLDEDFMQKEMIIYCKYIFDIKRVQMLISACNVAIQLTIYIFMPNPFIFWHLYTFLLSKPHMPVDCRCNLSKI